MIYEFDGFKPVIDESSFIHPQANVTGHVIIGKDVYIGPGAVIRGDFGKIIIEDGANVQENCTIHMFPGVTVLIKKGTLNVGDIFICGSQASKVRALLNERNIRVKQALPSDPVQILGFTDVPNSGEEFVVMNDEREAKNIAQKRAQLKREAEQRRFRKITLDQIGKEISLGKVKELNIIIKGDVDGSIEALSDSLMSLSTDEVQVKIVHRSTGNINDNDVTLASASQAVIIAFNVKVSPEAKLKARELEVDIRNYSIIYDAINDIKDAMDAYDNAEKKLASGSGNLHSQIKLLEEQGMKGKKDIPDLQRALDDK